MNERLRGLVSPSATGTRRTRNSSPGGHWPCGWPFGEHEPGTHVSNTSGSGGAGGGVLATAVGSVALHAAAGEHEAEHESAAHERVDRLFS